MKKLLLTAALIAASSPAFAACELNYSTVVSYKGEADYTTARGWKNLDAADYAAITAKGNSIVASAEKLKGNGDYSIQFNQSGGCDGAKADDSATVVGITLQNANKIGREGQKLEADLLKMSDDAHGKGKKRAWGKE